MPHDPRAVGGLLHQDREAVLAQRRPSSPRRLPNETCSKSTRRGVPLPFFVPKNGADPAPHAHQVSPKEPPWNFWPPRHPAGGRGAETYVAPPSAGRRPAVRPPQVLPPAGPSHLTPSRPGEAKSWSDEAPRCPNQFRSPNQKTAGLLRRTLAGPWTNSSSGHLLGGWRVWGRAPKCIWPLGWIRVCPEDMRRCAALCP